MGAMEQDPFAAFTAPPKGETPEEKAIRERKEQEAQRISDQIDQDIKAERALLKKRQGVVKVLLLGQSESGKSTTLKNFRMAYARSAWKQERASWRSVIQLNIIRSIMIIFETLEAETDALIDNDFEEDGNDSMACGQHDTVPLTEKHQLLKLRLGPLRRVETDLKRRLGAGADEETAVGGTEVLDGPEPPVTRPKEFYVRGWRSALVAPGALVKAMKNGASWNSHGGNEKEVVDEATEVIACCKEDMKVLWTDETVRAVLRRKRMRLEDSAGFFLNDLDRIATRSYEPSDDDIVRARLRTLGVQEYRIQFDTNAGPKFLGVGSADGGNEWILYDVGGARTLRNAWLPFFDNVNAIIFLAPISCFDEQLLEDPDVNRLEDSFLLWKAICSSKILKQTTMILFLNKCDILRRKLRSGILLRDYLPNYGDRPNDAADVLKFMKDRFKDILKRSSPQPRVSYFYGTSVTDTKATANTLKTVRDSILRDHLKNADLV